MNRQANPGEIIRIKHPPWKGQQFVVAECPQRFKGGVVEHHTWVEDNLSAAMHFSDPDDYVIITPSIVSDTPVDVEKSLKQKRDALLRGYFT